ncbi:selenide, water dikinase [Thecamonas trahens ATCC 50062]|uniref:Selenide, water dikinase n=1 Tax=Thecamonas trahens ATCC 50062 TaxID=461836 RepID=A0A0L0DEQ3_THETB|nr:selenide, water dikinase [Thecamonas trahens ATCC 50062]KNC50705.1 selenide, water dikinase [Thecamonas trahens ATCC 50062]|eukprot:XP_013762582.1 selenide, water dikinase [Thecamonas trahens ATCC 50062]
MSSTQYTAIDNEAIGLDCSIIPTAIEGVVTIQTTDYFYPLVEDPYQQGRIACANVLSDLFAMGISRCDTMLMILAASLEMPKDQRMIVTRELIRGFNDLATEAGTSVTGGQTVLNPWPIIGGVASAVVPSDGGYIDPFSLVPGDVMVLTKPIGTQVAVNAYQWLGDHEAGKEGSNWDLIADVLSPAQARVAFALASASMARLNKSGAALMVKHGAHGATDVTGFGLLGHARNLAEHQKAAVHISIHTLPVIENMPAVNDKFNFKLLDGWSSETSGGLLVALPSADAAAAFCADIEAEDGWPAWIVGSVSAGSGSADIVENPPSFRSRSHRALMLTSSYLRPRPSNQISLLGNLKPTAWAPPRACIRS